MILPHLIKKSSALVQWGGCVERIYTTRNFYEEALKSPRAVVSPMRYCWSGVPNSHPAMCSGKCLRPLMSRSRPSALWGGHPLIPNPEILHPTISGTQLSRQPPRSGSLTAIQH